MARFVLTVILMLTVFVALSQPGDNGTPGNETAGTYESSKNATSDCVVVFFITSGKVKALVGNSRFFDGQRVFTAMQRKGNILMYSICLVCHPCIICEH